MPESPTMSPAAPEAGIDIVPTPADGTVQETTVVVTEHEVLLGTAAALASSLELGDTEPEAPAVPPRRRLWTLTVACMGVALVISSMVALNTVLGEIAVATSATQTQLTWVVDSYTLVLACLLLPAGAIGDRYGRRCALLLGLAIFAPRWRR